MRRLPVLLSIVALAVAAPGLGLAQTPPPAAVSNHGVSVAETQAWLTGLGGTVGAPRTVEGVTSLYVADQPLPWNLTFYACGTGLCDDIQYSAVFSGPITVDQINAWNRDNRFLQAFFVPATAGGEAGAAAQFPAQPVGIDVTGQAGRHVVAADWPVWRPEQHERCAAGRY